MDDKTLLELLIRTQRIGEFLMAETDTSKAEKRLRRLIGANNGGVCIWLAGRFSRYQYPRRLANAKQVDQDIRDSALELIVDSAIGDEDVGNEFTLKKARRFNADYVLPADTVHDGDATHAANVDMVEQASEPRDPTVIPILQPPYDEQYTAYSDFYDQFAVIALGGIRNCDPDTQIAHLEQARDLLPGKTRHALGVGTKLKVLHRLRQDPELVDWVDTSTPERTITNGEVRDAEWDCRDELVSGFTLPKGEESTTVRARFAYSMAVMMNYLLSPYADGAVFDRFDDQQTIADVKERTPTSLSLKMGTENSDTATTTQQTLGDAAG